jgi:hypothetical protein
MREEFKEVKASIRETTEYLTNGKQHSLDIINGHAISQCRAPAFSRYVRSCVGDAEGGQGSDRVACVVAEGGGKVDGP